MTDGWKSAERTEDIRTVLLKFSDLFSSSTGGQVIFRLFGTYEGVPNLLFTVIKLMPIKITSDECTVYPLKSIINLFNMLISIL